MELRKNHEYQIITGDEDFCEKELNKLVQTHIITIQGYHVINNDNVLNKDKVSILITKRAYSDIDEE